MHWQRCNQDSCDTKCVLRWLWCILRKFIEMAGCCCLVIILQCWLLETVAAAWNFGASHKADPQRQRVSLHSHGKLDQVGNTAKKRTTATFCPCWSLEAAAPSLRLQRRGTLSFIRISFDPSLARMAKCCEVRVCFRRWPLFGWVDVNEDDDKLWINMSWTCCFCFRSCFCCKDRSSGVSVVLWGVLPVFFQILRCCERCCGRFLLEFGSVFNRIQTVMKWTFCYVGVSEDALNHEAKTIHVNLYCTALHYL